MTKTQTPVAASRVSRVLGARFERAASYRSRVAGSPTRRAGFTVRQAGAAVVVEHVEPMRGQTLTVRDEAIRSALAGYAVTLREAGYAVTTSADCRSLTIAAPAA